MGEICGGSRSRAYDSFRFLGRALAPVGISIDRAGRGSLVGPVANRGAQAPQDTAVLFSAGRIEEPNDCSYKIRSKQRLHRLGVVGSVCFFLREDPPVRS